MSIWETMRAGKLDVLPPSSQTLSWETKRCQLMRFVRHNNQAQSKATRSMATHACSRSINCTVVCGTISKINSDQKSVAGKAATAPAPLQHSPHLYYGISKHLHRAQELHSYIAGHMYPAIHCELCLDIQFNICHAN